jgi:hypothetical protein
LALAQRVHDAAQHRLANGATKPQQGAGDLDDFYDAGACGYSVARHCLSGGRRLEPRPRTYVDRSPAEQRAALLGAGLSPLVADLLVGLDQMFRESVIAEATSTVEELTGRAPRSLTEWLTENLDVFRAAPA